MQNKTQVSFFLFILIAALMLSGCSFYPKMSAAQPSTISVSVTEATPEITPEPVPVYPSGAGKVRISEVMSKNKATLQDAAGNFPDWIEIENLSGEDVDLTGWTLRDKSEIWEFPAFTLYSSSRAIIFASKKPELTSVNELHTSFALSAGDTLCLSDRNGDPVSSCSIAQDETDWSLIPDENGSWTLCSTPTPGFENSKAGFDAFMNSRTPVGPLVINEVCTDNLHFYYNEDLDDYPDWAEIRNISDVAVDLSAYCLSDDAGNLSQFTLSGSLGPRETTVILCSKHADQYRTYLPVAPFSLNAENEQLYLSTQDGTILDFVSLKQIPSGMSYGRIPSANGFFYLYEASPAGANGTGVRRVAAQPVLLGKDGVYNGVDSVTVELVADGTIYYTLDGSCPTQASPVYTGPITLTETTVIRAINEEPDAVLGRPLSLSYIINENHTLPVVSLLTDEPSSFGFVYLNGIKNQEFQGSVSLYEENGDSFTIGCGVKMHGATSLVLPKKNMSLSFRGSYGADKLNYDIFGGGVTSFTDLVLRAGQDQYTNIVRNEMSYSLASEFSDAIYVPRFRYCVLYVNGTYSGIYALEEKPNEQFVASTEGVHKSSVEMLEASVYGNDTLYKEVLDFIYANRLSDAANYDYVKQLLDVDSLIDWDVLQGYFSNYDLADGNLRYVRSTEMDNRWRLVFYDLDCSLLYLYYYQTNVFSFDNQITLINRCFVRNADFRAQLYSRAREAYTGVLSLEHIFERFDELCKMVEPEVERDSAFSGMSVESWHNHNELFKQQLLEADWVRNNIYQLCSLTGATQEEIDTYFGDLLA